MPTYFKSLYHARRERELSRLFSEKEVSKNTRLFSVFSRSFIECPQNSIEFFSLKFHLFIFGKSIRLFLFRAPVKRIKTLVPREYSETGNEQKKDEEDKGAPLLPPRSHYSERPRKRKVFEKRKMKHRLRGGINNRSKRGKHLLRFFGRRNRFRSGGCRKKRTRRNARNGNGRASFAFLGWRRRNFQ